MPGTKLARIAMIAVAAVVIIGLVLSMIAAPTVY
jgi:hypothetical protein